MHPERTLGANGGCLGIVLAVALVLITTLSAHAAPSDPNTGSGTWVGCRKVGSAWICTPMWPIVRK